MNAIYEWLGWFFCEAAFRIWDLEKEPKSDEEFKARCLSDEETIFDVMAKPLYRLGIWFSEEAEI